MRESLARHTLGDDRLCICCQVEMRLKHSTERTEGTIYPFLGFASQSDWSRGYTQLLLFALTSFSTLFLQLSSKSTQHIMVLQPACCRAALAKQSPETACKRCFHWGITGLYLMMLIMPKSMSMFYMTYFQNNLSLIWPNTFIAENHDI